MMVCRICSTFKENGIENEVNISASAIKAEYDSRNVNTHDSDPSFMDFLRIKSVMRGERDFVFE